MPNQRRVWKWMSVPAVFLAAGLCFAQVGAAPESEAAAEERDGAFFETVDVSVVNIDVYVTDKKGNPITGLTRDDFELLERKKPVAITNFYAVEAGRPLKSLPAPVPATTAEKPAPGPLEPPAIPEEQRLNLIIYVDNFNLKPFSRNRTFRRIREFLHDHVDREDRVMLVSYDRSLHIRQPFTTDPSLVADALYELEDLTGHRVHFESERQELLRDLNEAEQVGEVEWRVRQFAESTFSDLQFTIDAITQLIESLAGLEGRKALLYVSDGLQMTAAEDLYFGMMQKFGVTSVMASMSEFNATRRFKYLADQASANRVVFYTIDAAGLRVASSASAEVATAGTAGLSSFIDSTYIRNLQSPLQFLAEQTGGKAIINTNDIGDDLDKIANDFETYYSLGFSPPHAGDGRWYPVTVKVKDRKGLRVRHRSGYRDKKLYTRMAEGTRATLLYGYHTNEMGIDLRFGSSTATEDGQFNVPIAVAIPLGKLELVPSEEVHVARLKLFFSALDDREREAEVTEVPLDIRIPAAELETALEQFYIYEVALRMRGGPHRVAVGVRDEVGAVESFVTRTINIGSG